MSLKSEAHSVTFGGNIQSMTGFIVGFDGKWQEKFDFKEEAVEWAREVAATGRTVEVITRRFGFCSFLTGFPDSERAALKARWRRPVGLSSSAPLRRAPSAVLSEVATVADMAEAMVDTAAERQVRPALS